MDFGVRRVRSDGPHFWPGTRARQINITHGLKSSWARAIVWACGRSSAQKQRFQLRDGGGELVIAHLHQVFDLAEGGEHGGVILAPELTPKLRVALAGVL